MQPLIIFQQELNMSKLNTSASFTGKLLSSEQGNASIEYAVLLSMIVSAVFLGAEMLDPSTSEPYQEVSQQNSQIVTLVDGSQRNWINTVQLLAAFGFLTVATGFVARSVIRQRILKSDDFSDMLHPVNTESEADSGLFTKRQELFKQLAGNNFLNALQDFTVSRLMTTHVAAVGPKTPVARIHQLMTQKRIHHVIVTELNGKLLGVISDRDLMAKHAATAQELMTPDPVCVAPETSILPAVTIMVDRRISCVPVVRNERLLGMITSTDVMLAMQSLLQVLHIKLAPAQEPVAN
jgi:CBS domain-containing protein